MTLDSSNFGLAIGFYLKPNTSFLDVSAYINSTSNLGIKVTQITFTRDPTTNYVSQTNTSVTDFVQCSNTYFDNFKDSNTDYSFMSNLQNAFCLNPSTPLTLTASSNSAYHYANVEIYDKTSTAST